MVFDHFVLTELSKQEISSHILYYIQFCWCYCFSSIEQ